MLDRRAEYLGNFLLGATVLRKRHFAVDTILMQRIRQQPPDHCRPKSNSGYKPLFCHGWPHG